jgi:uncharacterized protein (DUF924 family)
MMRSSLLPKSYAIAPVPANVARDPRTVPSMNGVDEILAFWFGPGAQGKWFRPDANFDALIRSRFLDRHEEARAGGLASWAGDSDGALALVLLLDQFPRNMFRVQPRAFATDAMALGVADAAIARDFDLAQAADRRGFFYLPFMHAEDLAAQRRCVDLIANRGGGDTTWAVKHLRIIERFGRFPHRNAALGRLSSPEEIAFLKQPGSSF